jgi:hypothetical protein
LLSSRQIPAGDGRGGAITVPSWKAKNNSRRMRKGKRKILFSLWVKGLKLYWTVIRPTVVYECETWVLKENITQKFSVFEWKILRKIFGPKRKMGVGESKRT